MILPPGAEGEGNLDFSLFCLGSTLSRIGQGLKSDLIKNDVRFPHTSSLPSDSEVESNN